MPHPYLVRAPFLQASRGEKHPSTIHIPNTVLIEDQALTLASATPFGFGAMPKPLTLETCAITGG